MHIKRLMTDFVEVEKSDFSSLGAEGRKALKGFMLIVNEILHSSKYSPAIEQSTTLKRCFRVIERHVRATLTEREDETLKVSRVKVKRCFESAMAICERKKPSLKRASKLIASRFSQFNIGFSKKDKDTCLLKAFKEKSDKMELVTDDELESLQNMSKVQRHSCGANALEAMLYILSNPGVDEFFTSDIEAIMRRGIAQYRVLEADVEAKKHSSDPTVRMIAGFSAASDGATIHQVAGYYRPKGLEEVDLGEGTIPVTKTTLAAALYDIASYLKPNQGVIINLAGNDISISCRELADGSIGYFLFDSHATTTVGAILNASSSLEDTIRVLMDRIYFRVYQVEFKIFSLNHAQFEAYSSGS